MLGGFSIRQRCRPRCSAAAGRGRRAHRRVAGLSPRAGFIAALVAMVVLNVAALSPRAIAPYDERQALYRSRPGPDARRSERRQFGPGAGRAGARGRRPRFGLAGNLDDGTAVAWSCPWRPGIQRLELPLPTSGATLRLRLHRLAQPRRRLPARLHRRPGPDHRARRDSLQPGALTTSPAARRPRRARARPRPFSACAPGPAADHPPTAASPRCRLSRTRRRSRRWRRSGPGSCASVCRVACVEQVLGLGGEANADRPRLGPAASAVVGEQVWIGHQVAGRAPSRRA